MAKFICPACLFSLLLILSVEAAGGRNSNPKNVEKINSRELAEERNFLPSGGGPSQTPRLNDHHHFQTYTFERSSSVDASGATAIFFEGGYFLKGQDCLLNVCQLFKLSMGQQTQQVNESPTNHFEANYTVEGSSVDASGATTILFQGGYFVKGQDCLLDLCQLFKLQP